MGKIKEIALVLMILILSSRLVAVTAWSNGGYTGDGNKPLFATHDWIALHSVDNY